MSAAVKRPQWLLALGALALLLAASGCGGSAQKATVGHDEGAAQSTSVAQTPCEDGDRSLKPCRPRDVSYFHLFSDPAGGGIGLIHGPESTVEDVLEKGLELAEASPVHLAVRGTAAVKSVRCGWRGTARTSQQREEAIRFWLVGGAVQSGPSVPGGQRVHRLHPVWIAGRREQRPGPPGTCLLYLV